jgi:hypothetical protein
LSVVRKGLAKMSDPWFVIEESFENGLEARVEFALDEKGNPAILRLEIWRPTSSVTGTDVRGTDVRRLPFGKWTAAAFTQRSRELGWRPSW